MLVVGGHEDRGRHALGPYRLHHGEAVHLRHLHVEEDGVGVPRVDESCGARSVGRFLHRNVGGDGAESLGHAHAGEPFVVDDEDAFDGGRHGSAGSAGMEECGRSTMPRAPRRRRWMNRAPVGPAAWERGRARDAVRRGATGRPCEWAGWQARCSRPLAAGAVPSITGCTHAFLPLDSRTTARTYPSSPLMS